MSDVLTPASSTDDDATIGTGSTSGGGSSSVTPGTVLLLQAARGYPSISILLSTRPAQRLDRRDAVTLERLVAEARERVADEGLAGWPELQARLDALATEVVDTPVQRALALYVSAAATCRVDLQVDVVDRCVVDASFATRDLVRALHRTPRHVVLVLSAREARLFEGVGQDLAPVEGVGFPRRREPGRSEPSFHREVDTALGTYLRLRPAPLVLVGAEPTISAFRRMSRNTSRLAGLIRGNHLTTPLDAIAELVGPVLERYLLSRQQDALDLIERRAGEDSVVFGLRASWLAALWERPEMLAVEQGYFQPARLGPDGDTLEPATDVTHPDVIDDIVDELIEVVLRRGGWVALLDDGTLPDDSRVALTVRDR